jgi:hypothetical protein
MSVADLSKRAEELRDEGAQGTRVVLVEGQAAETAVSALQQVATGDPRKGVAALVDVMSPSSDQIRADIQMLVRQADRTSQAHTDMLLEFKAYTPQQLAGMLPAQLDPTAKTPMHVIDNWVSGQRLLALEFDNRTWFPAFQLGDDGEPLPVLGEIIPLLARGLQSQWEQAMWFVVPNGWLGGPRPVDLLHSEPQSVVAAADAQYAEAPSF